LADTGSIIELQKHKFAVPHARAQSAGWNEQGDLGSNNGPITANVKSVDESLALENKEQYRGLQKNFEKILLTKKRDEVFLSANQ